MFMVGDKVKLKIEDEYSPDVSYALSILKKEVFEVCGVHSILNKFGNPTAKYHYNLKNLPFIIHEDMLVSSAPPELKSCPFCGSNLTSIQKDFKDLRVICNKCESSTKWFKCEKDAIEIWNRREINF